MVQNVYKFVIPDIMFKALNCKLNQNYYFSKQIVYLLNSLLMHINMYSSTFKFVYIHNLIINYMFFYNFFFNITIPNKPDPSEYYKK